MEALVVPSREDGRCHEVLCAGADAWGCEALLTAWGEGMGLGKWAHRLWGRELGCVWRRVMEASVRPPGTLLCSQHGWKAPRGPAHLY